ncbi:MAG: hypothetical protein ACRDFW_09250 [bacterium]
MKTVVVALIFVVVVAARGMRAQAIYPQASAAFGQCRERCEALPGARATNLDGDQSTHAGDFADIEVAGSNRECFFCGIEALDAQVRALDHDYLGGLMPRAQRAVHALVFDPAD